MNKIGVLSNGNIILEVSHEELLLIEKKETVIIADAEKIKKLNDWSDRFISSLHLLDLKTRTNNKLTSWAYVITRKYDYEKDDFLECEMKIRFPEAFSVDGRLLEFEEWCNAVLYTDLGNVLQSKPGFGNASIFELRKQIARYFNSL
jgi:hypothetical protein